MPNPQRIRWIFACLIFTPLSVSFTDSSNTYRLVELEKLHENTIRSVIQQQLNAFNREDYDTAYFFASRHIQIKFSRPEFEQMVKTEYRQIAKSQRAVIDKIAFSGGEDQAVATVTITGADRITITANYRMTLEDGRWKVDGVLIINQRTPIVYEQN